MAKFKAPKFGTLAAMRGGGRHAGTSTPLRMTDDNGEDTGGGRHRREGRHGIAPGTQPQNRYQEHAGSSFFGQAPAGKPAGQHRRGARPAPARRAQEAPSDTWYPTKTDWRALMAGQTVNGLRLTKS